MVCRTNGMSNEIKKKGTLFDMFLVVALLLKFIIQLRFPRRVPKHRTEYYEKSFHYSVLLDWNDMPINLHELPTINTFRRHLRLYMKSKT